MTEREYIIVCNLQRIRAAMKILHDILPDYGVTKEEVREVVNKLDDIAARISDKEIKFKK